jgi:hypothetical protein
MNPLRTLARLLIEPIGNGIRMSIAAALLLTTKSNNKKLRDRRINNYLKAVKRFYFF